MLCLPTTKIGILAHHPLGNINEWLVLTANDCPPTRRTAPRNHPLSHRLIPREGEEDSDAIMYFMFSPAQVAFQVWYTLARYPALGWYPCGPHGRPHGVGWRDGWVFDCIASFHMRLRVASMFSYAVYSTSAGK
jgi:hypothetical protein